MIIVVAVDVVAIALAFMFFRFLFVCVVVVLDVRVVLFVFGRCRPCSCWLFCCRPNSPVSSSLRRHPRYFTMIS